MLSAYFQRIREYRYVRVAGLARGPLGLGCLERHQRQQARLQRGVQRLEALGVALDVLLQDIEEGGFGVGLAWGLSSLARV